MTVLSCVSRTTPHLHDRPTERVAMPAGTRLRVGHQQGLSLMKADLDVATDECPACQQLRDDPEAWAYSTTP